jgi:hypothetical protein
MRIKVVRLIVLLGMLCALVGTGSETAWADGPGPTPWGTIK